MASKIHEKPSAAQEMKISAFRARLVAVAASPLFFQFIDQIRRLVFRAFFGGLILVSPVVFYQAWAFVNPALTKRERKRNRNKRRAHERVRE